VSDLPQTAAPHPTYRLIPSRFPPIGVFDTVATTADLAAVMELEGWTNDRLVKERLARLPPDDWVLGVPNASIVLAAFLHAAPQGGRFTAAELGAWYAAASLTTAVAEVAHHLRREAVARGLDEIRRTFRCYTARLCGDDYIDLRRLNPSRPELVDPTSYALSQSFGERVRSAGRAGIVYGSVRHSGGTNTVCYRPRSITEVVQSDHFDLLVPVKGRIVARRLAGA
jgi:hypothetical protein